MFSAFAASRSCLKLNVGGIGFGLGGTMGLDVLEDCFGLMR